ncbi:hypothetical protein BJX61DRAFT_455713 [Aspergillus egyptiacus]|nr:hypothetical protein BJX61DRAFT_455713 [Aspergillus egyptiacus]
MSTPLVLVTGGTGFVAKWVIAELLRANYRVRTTVRNPSRSTEIHASLREAGITESQITSSLEVATADLLSDEGWEPAMADVTYVQHLASPVPAVVPENEDELIKPAVEGTTRVLRAAAAAGSVRRIVVTSSICAVYGWGEAARQKKVFTEADWTDVSAGSRANAYTKSKTLAERAAWEFVEHLKESGSSPQLEMTVINPGLVLGPALGKEDGTSLSAVAGILDGSVPGVPRMQLGVIDVRDCATMHVAAMTEPKAAGERFISIGEGSLWIADVGRILKRNLGERGKNVTTWQMPDLLVRAAALFLPAVRQSVEDLGVEREMNCSKAKELLGWEWKYSSEEAVLATAESLLKFRAEQSN